MGNHSDILQQSLAFTEPKLRAAATPGEAVSHPIPRCYEDGELWWGGRKSARTQGENVGAAGSCHMVLLDGLVECRLTQQQEAEANPHGQ